MKAEMEEKEAARKAEEAKVGTFSKMKHTGGDLSALDAELEEKKKPAYVDPKVAAAEKAKQDVIARKAAEEEEERAAAERQHEQHLIDQESNDAIREKKRKKGRKQAKTGIKLEIKGNHDAATLAHIVALTNMETGVDESANPDAPPKITETSSCTWAKTDRKSKMRYHCSNTVIRDRHTKTLLPFCGYHVKCCPMSHAMTSGEVPIDIPNPDGLCLQHYQGVHLEDPPTYGDPADALQWKLIPGVQRLVRKEELQIVKPHPMAPRRMHPDDISSSSEEESNDDDDYSGSSYSDYSYSDSDDDEGGAGGSAGGDGDKSAYQEDYFMYKKRMLTDVRATKSDYVQWWLRTQLPVQINNKPRLKFLRKFAGRKADRNALKIQKLFRGYQSRYEVRKKVADTSFFNRRDAATRTLQRYSRGHLGRCFFHRHWDECKAASTQCQRVCRGWMVRFRTVRYASAQKIQRCFKTYLAQQLLQSLKLGLKSSQDQELMEWAIKTLQRYMRGAIARRRAKKMAEKRALEKRMATDIQRVYRGYLGRVRVELLWAEEMRERRARVLLQKMVRGFLQRRQVRWHKLRVQHASLVLQRVYRGHLGRCDRDRQLTAMEAWWAFVNPELERDQFDPILARSSYHAQLGVVQPMVLGTLPTFLMTPQRKVNDLLLGMGGLGYTHDGHGHGQVLHR